MKVNLAAQTLSNSVATAIDFLRDKKQLSTFKNSQATTKFIKIINELFDVCNSKSPKEKGTKSALFLHNLEDKIIFLTDASNYLFSLKNVHGQRMCETQQKQGFLGFMNSIAALIGLSRKLLIEKQFKFFLTYKVCQDHLETFFSQIRRFSGWNNNPNCLNFKYALRKNLLKNGIKPSPVANCTDQTDTSECSMPRNKKVPSKLSGLIKVIEAPSNVHADILFYISGFVAKKMSKVKFCSQCSSLLIKKAEEVQHSNAAFTNLRDKGGLLASTDIFNVILEADLCLGQLITSRKLSTLSQATIIKKQTAACEAKRLLNNYCCKKSILFNVCRCYTKVLMHHNARLITQRCIRENKASKRHTLTKAVIFKHQ